jgi:Leucine rich repeat
LTIALPGNGLSGSIPPHFFNLTALQSLDFNENDLRGKIPAEIGKLTNLKTLRLSYNSLTGIPPTFENLKNLSLLHIHGNRISGDDSHILIVGDTSIEGPQFISDCGSPTDSEGPFKCTNCDICCNSLEECQAPIQSQSFDGNTYALIIVAIVLAVMLVVSLLIWFLARKKKVMPLSRMNAKDACGEESVYSFILSNSRSAWLLTCGTIVIQVMTFALFLSASSFDSEVSDFVYSWRCPRNSMECVDERNIDGYGWTVWTLLVFTSLLEDFANGLKLVYISVSRASLHCFISSAILLAISSLAAYTSFVYNRAIALSNTELIVNAVILLFVNDIDELMFNAIRVIFPSWVDDLVRQADVRSSILTENVENDGGVSKKDEIPAEGCNSLDSSSNRDELFFFDPMTMSSTMEDGVWRGSNIDGSRVNSFADKDSGNADTYRITQSAISNKIAKLEMQRGMIEEEQENTGTGHR